jgi:hypothetical protein
MKMTNLGKILVETKVFTEPFIHTNRLIELKLFDVTNNGGAWRTHFEKLFRITVVYTTKIKPLHKNLKDEDEEKYKQQKLDIATLPHPKEGKVLGLYVWGRLQSNSRTIPDDIRSVICGPGARCLICDEDRRIECDHVNDDYTIALSDLKISDFQPLCQSCNKKKREAHKRGIQYYKDIRDSGKSVIKQLLNLPNDFKFTWIAPEELSGDALFYRNPKYVRQLHFDRLKNNL